MSPLGDVIVELLGGALEGVFGSRGPAPQFPEGMANASMGVAAGAMAFLSLLFGIPTFIFAVSSLGVRGTASLVILALGLGSALLAWGTIRVGSRALRVTKRNANLSHLSRAMGYSILSTSAVSSILGAIGVLRWLV
jgi:hypothetical protein